MTDLSTLGVAEAAREIAAGRLTSLALTEALLDRIAAREEIGAWIWLDPDLARAQARAADAVPMAAGRGPLHGVPIAVKDIIETADMPTQNGYRGHEGRHTHRDAFCVQQLRDAGAVILGKTVTTELAVRTPGKTVNPHDVARTPGGSSSGTAAAVADRQVAAGLGTQTGGSVIRPASFCGVVGYKPSFGMIGRTGVTMMADWLDTVGVMARSVEDAALVAAEMFARDLGDAGAEPRSRPPITAMAMAEGPPPRLGWVRTAVWEQADPEARAAFEAYADASGASEIVLPDWMAEAWDWHSTLQLYAISRHYGPLLDDLGPDVMSESLRGQIAKGRSMTETAYRMAQDGRKHLIAGLADPFADVDAVLCLPAPGIAPMGHDWTGDPVFNSLWTMAGSACVTVPLLEVSGMPLGVQVVAPMGLDAVALRAAQSLMV